MRCFLTWMLLCLSVSVSIKEVVSVNFQAKHKTVKQQRNNTSDFCVIVTIHKNPWASVLWHDQQVDLYLILFDRGKCFVLGTWKCGCRVEWVAHVRKWIEHMLANKGRGGGGRYWDLRRKLILRWKASWDYSFTTYAKFSEKLTFLTPRYAHVRVRIRG